MNSGEDSSGSFAQENMYSLESGSSIHSLSLYFWGPKWCNLQRYRKQKKLKLLQLCSSRAQALH